MPHLPLSLDTCLKTHLVSPLTILFVPVLAVGFGQSLCWTDCELSIAVTHRTPRNSCTKVGGCADSSIIIKLFPRRGRGSSVQFEGEFFSQGCFVQVAAAASLSGIFVWSLLIAFRNRTDEPVTQHQTHTCAGRLVHYESWKCISILVLYYAVNLLQHSV